MFLIPSGSPRAILDDFLRFLGEFCTTFSSNDFASIFNCFSRIFDPYDTCKITFLLQTCRTNQGFVYHKRALFLHICWIFFEQFWIILGQFWDHFGIMFGQFLDNFGIILGSFWDNVGFILGQFWDHFGINL